MGTYSKIAVAAILTFAIAACSSDGVQQNSNPASNNTPAAIRKAATQPFNNPVVSAKKAQSVTVVSPNLIPLTNATQRVGVVLKGRSDPFAQIVNPAPVGVPSATVAPKTVPVLPKLPISARKPQKPSTGRDVLASAPVQKKVSPHVNLTRPVLPKVLPQVIPNQTLVSVLPPPQQPELAKGVLVTGIVQIGQEPQAIIKVPNEPTSRYVQAGQRLANGLVIKRIEMNQGSEPTVILEQYGIEVAKMVGEAPVNTKSSSTGSTTNHV
jgi:hypothetical protein